MTDKELKRASRGELLEILLRQRRRIEALETENTDLRAQLESRRIDIESAGSIAEASLAISRIFEEAQRAADQYLENVRRLSEEAEAEAEQKLEQPTAPKLTTQPTAAQQSQETEAPAPADTTPEKSEQSSNIFTKMFGRGKKA